MTEAGWTAEAPKVSGWYWWRSSERSYEEVLMVLGDEKLGCPLFAIQDGEDRSVSRLGGEWLGPLTPDSYQQGRVAAFKEVIDRMTKALPLYGNDEWRERMEVEAWIRWIRDAQQAQDEKGVGDD